MKRLFSNLITLLIFAGLYYACVLYVNPYWFKDIAPNYIMGVSVGNQTRYFPLRYIEPRYVGDQYGPANEAVVWLGLDAKTYKILPQGSPAIMPDDKIAVAVTSDLNHATKRVTDQFKALQRDEKTFKTAQYDLKSKQSGDTTDYLAKDTRVTCAAKSCLLFHMEQSPQRLIIVFNDTHLADWQKMIGGIDAALQRTTTKPAFVEQVKNILPAPLKKFFMGAAQDIKKNV